MIHDTSRVDITSSPKKEEDKKRGFVAYSILPIFGSSLYQLLRLQEFYDCRGLPNWLAELFSQLNRDLITNVSQAAYFFSTVYTPSDGVNLNQLYQRLCSGLRVNWEDSFSEGALILRLIVERLPEPLLTFDMHDLWISAIHDIWESDDARIDFINALIAALPPVSREFFHSLLRLFSTVYTKEKEEKSVLKEGLTASICEVWGPILLMRKEYHSESEYEDAVRLLMFLIENCSGMEPQTPRMTTKKKKILTSKRDEKKDHKYPLERGASASTNINQKPPHWLANINKKKFRLLDETIRKLQRLIKFMQVVEGDERNKVVDVTDLHSELKHIQMMLIDTQKKIRYDSIKIILDTYHLNRCFRYLCEMQETFDAQPFHFDGTSSYDHKIPSLSKNDPQHIDMVSLCLSNERMNDRIHRLCTAIYYEFTLFIEYTFDYIANPTPEQIVSISDAIDYIPGREWWSSTFGSTTRFVGWQHFTENFCRALKKPRSSRTMTLSKIEQEKLKQVLDPKNTDFVYYIRFAYFFKAFRFPDLGKNFAAALKSVSQDWFYPFLSQTARIHLFTPLPIGVFLVRFSTTAPGALACDFKVSHRTDEDTGLRATQIFPRPNGGYYVKTPDADLNFDSLEEVIQQYTKTKLFTTPLTDSIITKPYFYGLLTKAEAEWLLNDKPCGTYLVRFSLSLWGQLAISVVSAKKKVNTFRIQRLDAVQVMIEDSTGNQSFKSLEHLFADYNKMEQDKMGSSAGGIFTIPLNESVSRMMDEFEAWRMSYAGFQSQKPEEFFAPQHILKQKPVFPADTFELLKEACKMKEYNSQLIAAVIDRCAEERKEDQWISNQKQACKSVSDELGVKRIKVTNWKVKFNKLELNEAYQGELIFNVSKSGVTYRVINPVFMDSNYFFSVQSPTGTLEKNKDTSILFFYALHTSRLFKYCLSIEFNYTSSNKSILYHIPIFASASSDYILNESMKPRDSIICNPEHCVDIQMIAKGHAAFCEIVLCKVYGAPLVVKRWFKTSLKDATPTDFTHEKALFEQFKHPSLVCYLGAYHDDQATTVQYVIEYCPNKNLYDFLPSNPLSSIEVIDFALDIAYGLNYIHSFGMVCNSEL
eukprot:TRINITY_DN1573_c0_g1_i11.p1 TRINITY_DN1573_c0_g1~~TRINITY_DN1573_c0_g1_i11.p1  ORF type:complete len:1101 (-),score=147.04 TRINITY_DN1573_c0_g1_i11:586-3888(-)